MADKFVNAPWDGPKVEASLNADDWCAVCLIDTNAPGAQKVKSNCKLPVQATPDGPYYTASMMQCANILSGSRGGVDAPQPDKLQRLFSAAGMNAHQGLKRLLGQ